MLLDGRRSVFVGFSTVKVIANSNICRLWRDIMVKAWPFSLTTRVQTRGEGVVGINPPAVQKKKKKERKKETTSTSPLE